MKSVEAKVEKTDKMETKLKALGEKIDELLAEAERSAAAAEDGYPKRIEALRTKRRAAEAKLEKLKTAGSGKWQRFESDVERAYDDLETAFKGLIK